MAPAMNSQRISVGVTAAHATTSYGQNYGSVSRSVAGETKPSQMEHELWELGENDGVIFKESESTMAKRQSDVGSRHSNEGGSMPRPFGGGIFSDESIKHFRPADMQTRRSISAACALIVTSARTFTRRRTGLRAGQRQLGALPDGQLGVAERHDELLYDLSRGQEQQLDLERRRRHDGQST